MRVVRREGGPAWLTVGWLIAILVLILGILGIVGVLPFNALVVFGLIIALAVAILL